MLTTLQGIIGLTLLVFVVGAFFRRWWGGWLSPNHFVKLGVGFGLPALIVGYTTGNVYAALAASVAIGMSWLNPFHSDYMRYGHPTDGSPNPSKLVCTLGHSLSYGAYTLLAGLAMTLVLHNWSFLYCAVGGLLTPVGYLIGWYLADKGYKLNFWTVGTSVFIDGPTAIGELGIGGFILGALTFTTLYFG